MGRKIIQIDDDKGLRVIVEHSPFLGIFGSHSWLMYEFRDQNWYRTDNDKKCRYSMASFLTGGCTRFYRSLKPVKVSATPTSSAIPEQERVNSTRSRNLERRVYLP